MSTRYCPLTRLRSQLTLSAGAAGIEVRNLANANAMALTLEGGAAGYTFDFGGVLRQDSVVKISTGVSSVDVTIPASTAAKVTSESFLGHVEVGDGFTTKDGAFWTRPALDGATPVLTIKASVALGALKLRTTAPVQADLREVVAPGSA